MIGDDSETMESVKGVLDRLTAKTAYGEAIVRDGVTVIPVARVMLGYGAGGGMGDAAQGDEGGDAAAPVAGGMGSGGGGGGVVQPIGYIELTETGSRWQPLEPPASEMWIRGLAVAAVLIPFGGRRFLLGRLLALVVGQAIAGRLSRPDLPSMDGFRSMRNFGNGN